MGFSWSILDPKYLILICTFYLFTNAYRIGKLPTTYIRPECLPNESCLYSAFGYRFEMCTCPGLSKRETCQANKSNAAFIYEVIYNFCSEAHYTPSCKPEQTSMTVDGLRTFIHCICDEKNNAMLKARTFLQTNLTIFVCTRQESFESN